MIKSVLVARSAFTDGWEPAWVRGLRELGVDCRMFDTHAHFPDGVLGRFQQRFLTGPSLNRVNRLLLEEVAARRPDVTLLYQGHHFWTSTVERLRRHTFVTGYHNDDPLGPRRRLLRYRHLIPALPHYHGYHCYRECTAHDVRAAGVPRVGVILDRFVPWDDFPRALSPEDRRRLECELTFIGHCERDVRIACLSAVVRAGIRVRIHGNSRFWRPSVPPDVWERLPPMRQLFGEDYRKALCGAGIAACFFSRWNRDQYTRRAFEIPACGVFLLAERTPVMQELYQEGVEAEYFETPEEFVEKACYYTKRPSARKRVAAAGYRRATQSGYDLSSRLKQWLQEVGEWREQALGGN